MVQAFKAYIAQIVQNYSDKKFLLAVSGGIDSIVMCHLFHESKLIFAIAHCNFKLRDNESDGDEEFVKSLAEKYKVAFFSTSFSTSEYAQQEKLSIQMAARKLRYDWFEKLGTENKFDFICTAHHQNDVAETVLINLTRGTGIAGLHGIAPVSGAIFRPLLFATKSEMEQYAKENSLAYREDSSNESDCYTRNRIRHHVIPVLKEINPNLEQTFFENTQLISKTEQFYLDAIGEKIKIFLIQKGPQYHINCEELKKEKHVSVLLYEMLKKFNFNAPTIKNIEQVVNSGDSGQQFFSATHILVKNGNQFVVEQLPITLSHQTAIIVESADSIDQPLQLQFKLIERAASFSIPKEKTIAAIDFEKLQFPLTLRPWQHGDYFYPLGMTNKKLLSDFFIDKKMSVLDKQKIRLLENGNGDIIWIAGHRLDNRFKVTEKTTQIYCCEIVPEKH